VLLDVSLIVIGVPFEGTAAMATEKKTAVPFCSIKNLTKRSVILPSTVGGHSGTSLIFTNHGSTACSLSGILRAQPVVGSKHTPVVPMHRQIESQVQADWSFFPLVREWPMCCTRRVQLKLIQRPNALIRMSTASLSPSIQQRKYC
jgi:hypothetical protein